MSGVSVRGHFVVGVDEAGRGPWAGPVAAAAVILDMRHVPPGIGDSKKLTPKIRAALFDRLCGRAQVSLTFAAAKRIDLMNIRAATLWAMRRAVLGLGAKALAEAKAVLIDGRDVPDALGCEACAIVGGDSREPAIAAASIIAKVARDRAMQRMAHLYPGYGFERHKGYGTEFHAAALCRLGPCALHRQSFRPVREWRHTASE